MDPFFQAYLDHIAGLHREMVKTFEGLEPEGLDWVPVAEQNSLAALAVHSAGAERFWISQVIGGQSFPRDRDAEFRTRGNTGAELTQVLDDTLERTRRVLESLHLADLDTTRTHPRDRSQRTVAWGLLHILEHAALHLGHMQVIRQWWDATR